MGLKVLQKLSILCCETAFGNCNKLNICFQNRGYYADDSKIALVLRRN